MVISTYCPQSRGVIVDIDVDGADTLSFVDPSRVHGIINRDDPASEKIILIHRLNDDYFKVVKTQDQFGFSLYDILSELGRLTYANYPNSVLTNQVTISIPS